MSHSATVTHDRLSLTFAKSRRPHSGLTERSKSDLTCLSVLISETAVNIVFVLVGDVQQAMFSGLLKKIIDLFPVRVRVLLAQETRKPHRSTHIFERDDGYSLRHRPVCDRNLERLRKDY